MAEVLLIVGEETGVKLSQAAGSSPLLLGFALS